MYIMYVDESGDPGTHPNSSPHFILSGLIVSQNDWDKYLLRLKSFRKSLKEKYNLNQRTEIHTSELIRVNHLMEYKSIHKSQRLDIIKDYCTQIPLIFDTAAVINICLKIDEHPDTDIFNLAWSRLLQRYDTFLKKSVNDKGIIVADDTDNNKLMSLQRKMRVYNPVPTHFTLESYNAPIDNIIEDTFSRSSHHSYFIQTVDIIAHTLYRKEYPKGSLKKFGLEKQFQKIAPILLKIASKNDEYGIVRK
jgi:Protein of unknown function (DUF3800)